MAKIKKRGRMPVHVSASQIKLAMMCMRAWFFNKVLKMPSIELEAHRVGGATHDFMEKWAVEGTLPEGKEFFNKEGDPRKDKNDTSRRAARYANVIIEAGLITRGPHLWGFEWKTSPETVFECPDGEKVPLLGYIDVLEELPNGELMVTDYKTMKTFQYMVESDELLYDPQCILYCKWVLDHIVCPGDVIHFRHICVSKTTLQVRESRVKLTREQVIAEWEGLMVPTVIKMRKNGRKKITKVLPNRGTACTNFGGCAQYMICQNIAYTGKEQLDVNVNKRREPARRWASGEIEKRKEAKNE